MECGANFIVGGCKPATDAEAFEHTGHRAVTCLWPLQDEYHLAHITGTESQSKTYFLLSNVLTVLCSLQWTKNKWTSLSIFMQTRLLTNWMNLRSHIYKFTYDNAQRFFPFLAINSSEYFNKCKIPLNFKWL